MQAEKQRHAILDEVLKQAAFDGLNDRALSRAAKKVAGDSRYGRIAFPRGISDLVEYFAEQVNEEMQNRLAAIPLKEKKIRERIALAVETRLAILTPYREGVRRLLSYYMVPQHKFQAARHVWKAADLMWYAAGDTSTDYNYYTKRGLLAGVYSSTLLFWISDESPDGEETKKFLARRIDNVMKIEKIKSSVRNFSTGGLPFGRRRSQFEMRN